MAKPNEQLLIEFDPDELRSAIRKLSERAAQLRQEAEALQRRAGLYDALLQEHAAANGRQRPVSMPPASRFSEMTIADAAYEVLQARGKQLGGREILEAVEAGGKPVGGKHPMGTLSTSMKRHPRIERVRGKTNVWRVKEG
jgi:hypothetical protein